MTVAVCIPWFGTADKWRRLSFDHTAKFWRNAGFEVYYGGDAGGSISAARNNAARKALADGHDVLCFADSDAQTPLSQIEAAAKLTTVEGCAAIAFTEFVKVRRKPTERVLGLYPKNWERIALQKAHIWPHHPACAVVVSADLYRSVGGFDQRLTRSWGHDDRLFLMACDVVSGFRYRRVEGRCWHWWHPKSPARVDRFEYPDWPNVRDLLGRYVAAAGLPGSNWPEGPWPYGDRHSGPGADRAGMIELLSEAGGPLA